MTDNPKIIAEVATLRERIDNAKEHIGEKIDDLEVLIRDMTKREEIWWQEFRKHEKATIKSFEEAARERTGLGVIITNNKKHCDDRFEDIEQEKRHANLRYRIRMGAMISVISSCATIITNLAVVAARKFLGDA